ncbi:MAG: NADH:ubiquinone reductase (Na(+)-transporting) subunit A [Rhodobacterales bacterium]|nr:NADH:ubiquinone reductase (Na(+)-transporting) subunit A [Rhodobacterales bacterium]
MAEHVVKRGLDIPIKGRASGEIISLESPASIAYAPTEFRGITPRLAVRKGDEIKQGQSLFFSKSNPDLVFRSPIAGNVTEVRRGARRVITDLVVEATDSQEVETLTSHSLDGLKSVSRADAVAAMLASGHWCAIRTRPLDNIADAEVMPQSILIGGMETGPAQPLATELMSADDADALQAAVYALKACTDGKVFLTERSAGGHPALSKIDGVERHTFSGPHPAGDPGVQVNLIDPPRGVNVVWTIRAWDAVALGRTLLSGAFDGTRVYAAVGAGVKAPRLVKTVIGAPLTSLVGDTVEGNLRWIVGSVLTGTTSEPGRWAGYYARTVHVLVDEYKRELMSWALPSLGQWSFYRSFVSGFSKATREYDLRTGLHGGRRAIVPIGAYPKVVPTPDIMPQFLFKSILANDLEESIQLGMLDITFEEAALCTFICPSKTEFGVILRDGLNFYEKEA